MKMHKVPIDKQVGGDQFDFRILSDYNAEFFAKLFEDYKILVEDVSDHALDEEWERFPLGNYGKEKYVWGYAGYSYGEEENLASIVKAIAEYHDSNPESWFWIEYMFEGDWYSRAINIRDGYIFYHNGRDLRHVSYKEKADTYFQYTIRDMWNYGYKGLDVQPILYEEAKERMEKGYGVWILYPSNYKSLCRNGKELTVDSRMFAKTIPNKVVEKIKERTGEAWNRVYSGLFTPALNCAVRPVQEIIEEFPEIAQKVIDEEECEE